MDTAYAVRRIERVPPATYFVGSAVFHYLGPAFAVLLFALVPPLGVAWLRIASAALVFAVWRRPWRTLAALEASGRRLILAMGTVLAVMNVCFYVSIDRLPLGTVAAIEFLPVILLAALGARTSRNGAALVLAVAGVYLLTDVQLAAEPVGLALRLRQRGALRPLHRPRAPGRAARSDERDRRARRGDADRLGRGDAAGRLGGGAGPHGPGRSPGGNRRGGDVLGDPIRLRPAGDGADAAGDLRPAGLAVARPRRR